MSRQDKSTTERHAKALRELIKRLENKLCADCKRNDPRWASWNLGVFLCIRCSGIHRGMGTHISKVKSVDLDVWTAEQMTSINKWGNRRANLYWEAHLKPGHLPPDHKMESFIRSKYESRRWALSEPPPSDPSVLDDASQPSTPPLAEPPANRDAKPSSRSVFLPHTTVKTGSHPLLSTSLNQRASPSVPTRGQPPEPASKPDPAPIANDLLSLDFHAPPLKADIPAQVPESSKDIKQDILSLYSSPAMNAPPPTPASHQFNSLHAQTSWVAPGHTQQVPTQPTQPMSMMGNTGTGLWGVNSGWSSSAATANAWSIPISPPTILGTSNPWVSTASTSTTSRPGGDLFGAPPSQQKEDAFADIWK